MEFLIGCGSSVAADAGNSLLSKIKRHISYLFHYNNNMKSLEGARVNLEAKRSDASRLEGDAITRFKYVGSIITQWKNEAENLHKEAQIIIAGSNRRSSCPNPWLLYSSSKSAWEMAQKINEKVQKAPDFGTTFDCPAPSSGNSFNLAGSVDFDSRLRILNGVLDALKDEEVSMCSICGMGGVGKTTMAKKLIQQVEALHLFDKVVMVTVSKNPDLQVIQREIIGQMGLEIKEDSETVRANRLNGWLKSNKTLLVLDDVWRKLSNDDFDKIGIPLDSKGCKMVLTSRNEDECKKMGSQRNFRVGFLDDREAWDLFREKAGNFTAALILEKTALDIASECGGLPIAIVTVATSLKGKSQGIWNNALLQLRNSNFPGISDMEKVYSRIELSYDLLSNKEAQLCFLLCCLFPEDYNIPIEHLVLYGMSLDLFQSVYTVNQARDRVESLIHELTSSFLLLDGDGYECVKMHDIVRDFAVSFSSKAEDAYVVKCENTVMTNWPETTKYKSCSAISIMCKKMLEHPVDLECPKLKLLQLDFGKDSEQFQDGIFEGMKELKVLSLNVRSLLVSLHAQKKLRTLFVTETSDRWGRNPPQGLGDSIGAHLVNLEYFSFYTRRSLKDFPEEIGLLCNLRYLLLNGVGFRYVPPGVLPKLVKLEELYLPWEFMDWGCKEYMSERINASLDEIESLPLTALEIGVRKGSILAEKLVRNLTRFQVFVGTNYSSDCVRGDNAKTLLEILKLDACDITASWISALLRKSESLVFTQVENLKNVTCLQLEDSGFEQLKRIDIMSCREMEYLVDRTDRQIPWTSCSFSQLESLKLFRMDNLKEICHFGPNFLSKEAPLLFRNLIRISISQCAKLQSVFPLSVARGLSQVQRISIRQCDEMEKVLYTDEANDDNQPDGAITQFRPTPETTSTLTVNHNKANLICPTPNSIIRGLLRRGKQPKNVPNQQQMEENSAKGVEKQADGIIVFPQLKVLELRMMPKLRVFYDGDHAIKLPSLESLRIDECNGMKAFSNGLCNTPILQQIQLNDISNPVGEDVNAFLKDMLKDGDEEDEIHDA